MTEPAGLKGRLAAGERLLGVLLRIPAEELVEQVAVSGFDFVLVDTEHGPAEVGLLRQHIAAAGLHGVPVLVRVGSHEPALVLRALDQGAAGIVAPHIDAAADAVALVQAAHYPPVGRRGFATYGRAGGFGTVGPEVHQRRMLDETLVIGMIESPAGVAAAGEILAVPGLDGTMVGVADLRASSGPDDPDPGDAIETVHRTVAEQGSWRMDIVVDVDAARRSFADGAQLVVYNLTATIMDHLAGLRRAGAEGRG